MKASQERSSRPAAQAQSVEEEVPKGDSGAPQRQPRIWLQLVGIVAVLSAIVLGALTSRHLWMPHVKSLLATAGDNEAELDALSERQIDHGHAGHAPGANRHPGHDDATALALSPEGRKNVGLELVTVELRDFDRTVTMPATIVERTGRSEITVSAPMTGTITRIYPIRGEAVVPGQRLFDLRLTHEDLVEKQSDLLRDLQQLDVVKREVARLEDVARSGAIAGKTLLERQYEQQKLEAAINAETQALRLHGLADVQIASIVDDRELLSSVTIAAPSIADAHDGDEHEDFLQFKEVLVKQGDHVAAGTALGVLSDHCQLYLEGQAFEHDAALLNRIANKGIAVSALIDQNGSGVQYVPDLKVLYIENQVEMDSRALRFYVLLPNELVRNETTQDGQRFIGWKFRPGQRVDLRIPVETWRERIVLPVESVVRDGAESYVFQENKGHFDRLAVHVVHRDRRWAVIEPDGSLFPGDVVAGKGAYQIHLALKNKSGAGVDPHAGHNH
jgi:multidrug efflux pump subunit AcrA (membrane-fusion protein)